MLKEQVAKRLATDEKYAQAKARLDKLNSDIFFIRYEDYFARACDFLRRTLLRERKAAKNRLKRQMKKHRKWEREAMNEGGPSKPIQLKPSHEAEPEGVTKDSESPPSSPSQLDEAGEEAANTFVHEHWAKIDDILSREDTKVAQWASKKLDGRNELPPSTPMIDLLEKLTDDQCFVAYLEARNSITNYSKRNDIAHSHIGAMMKENASNKAAKQIQEDLQNLAYITCMDKSTLDATRTAIFTTARLFFQQLKIDRTTGEVFSMVPWPKDKHGKYIRKEEESSVGYVDLDENDSASDSEDNNDGYY
ncbi:uncharacterized protein F4807DRAFT_312558 [Annulohypoxylon truncatum]|uniref:uncharacterized protein n=1 Tax=Annulohypoxylon truncatum TaxID=327061 RepID=UPI002008474E|nr:uncharacterized protein F4807DRAFT_312558 [Annulohypoxylon truncatum]KAI1213139.1 hypothetical protein F4807DRAFT_312558 [Annulohypoxylon truncatum]